MEKCKRILRRIFSPPPLLTVILAVFGYSLVVAVFAFPIDNPAIEYASYLCSAYALIITITGLSHLAKFVNAVRTDLEGHPLVKKVRGTALGNRILGDVRFRTEISLYQGLLVNLLYIAIKLFSGVYYRSFWFIALAVYYILLALMRFLLLRRGRKRTDRTPIQEEIHRYRLCGIILLVMNQALAGIVIFMVHQNRGFDYPGVLIYAMALYAFYVVIIAFINLIRFRKYKSPVLSAAKTINLVAALVSILSLETAMLAQFGGDDEAFRSVMTGATGGGVCTIVIGMAVFMIWKSTKQLKGLKGANHHG